MRASASICAFIVSSMRAHIGMVEGRRQRTVQRRAALDGAQADEGQRLLVGPLGQAHALEADLQRAAFIMMNMYSPGRGWASPTR